jgi:P pilus assembly chaperone PapD
MLKVKASSLVLSAISLLSFIPPADAIEIGVSPPRVVVDMNSKRRNDTNTITISNLSDKPVDMKAYVRNWTMNEKNQLEDIASTENSLDQWIVFTPSRFTIQPRKTQTVRFAIRPKAKPKPGEYRAVIYLEEAAPASNSNADAIDTVGRVGVVVYGYYGSAEQIKRDGAVNSVGVDVKPNQIQAVFDVTNKGNAFVRVEGQYAIWRAGKYPGAKATEPLKDIGNPRAKLPADVVNAGLIDTAPVLPSNNRRISFPLIQKLPPGNYILDINANLSGKPVDKGIPFTVPATTTSSKPNPTRKSP